MTSGHRAPDLLRKATAPTPDCIPLERFADARTDAERDHLEACARCQAELALWQEFDGSTATLDDGAAVQWIVAEVGRRRRSTQRETVSGPWRWLWTPRFAAALATLVVVASASYVLWDPEPLVRTRQDSASQVYRTGRVQASAPLNDVASAPHVFQWTAVGGAAAYDVTILEVDGTPLWRGSTSEPRAEIPAAVVALFVRGKTVLWEVTARESSGSVIGTSGRQQFRVIASRDLRKP